MTFKILESETTVLHRPN